MHVDMYSKLPLFDLEEILTFLLSCSVLVPFCYTVDLSAPSTIVEGPAASPQTHGTSTLHPPATDASQYTRAVSTSSASENRAKKLNLNVTDSGTLSKNNRKKSTTAGV